MMVFSEIRIFLQDRAGVRIDDMLFQRNHAVATGEHEEFIKRFEQFFVSGTVMGSSLQGSNNLLDHVHQHLFRGHDDHGDQSRTSENNKLGDLHEIYGMSARHHKSPKDGSCYNYRSENDDHE